MNWNYPYNNFSDEKLMSLVAAGKSAAMKEIYQRYNKKLLLYFFRMLGGDPEKSQDFLHELFLKILENAQSYDCEYKFSSWIFKIASNLCKNEYRRLKVRENVTNESDMDKYEQKTLDQDGKIDQCILEDIIRSELSRMEPERRSTFLLRYQENYSINEIGQILACSAGTVKSRLHYITRTLAQKLAQFYPTEIKENKVVYERKTSEHGV
jgi:RNA polymerase sigma-70 factor (ECF subfamily)